MTTRHDAPLAQRAFEHARTPTPAATIGPNSVEQAIRWVGGPSAPVKWKTTDAIGRLVVTPDGRPIRTAVTGRRVIVTGSYSSAKTKRTHPHESMHELAFLHESEVDVEVVDYRAQPFRFEYVGEQGTRTYIADCCRVLSSGEVEVVEIKADQRSLRDPDYAEKLEMVALMCDQIGWRFRTVTKAQLLEPPARRANIQLVQSRRMVGFGAQHVYAAASVIERAHGEATLGDVSKALGDPRIGCAVAMAMMVARILEIDLVAPISGRSKVTLVSRPSADLREAH